MINKLLTLFTDNNNDNATAEERRINGRMRTGKEAVVKHIDKHCSRLIAYQEKSDIPTTQLVATNLADSQDSPRRIRNACKSLADQIRKEILYAARDIEEGNFEAVAKNATKEISVTPADRKRVLGIIDGQKELHVSYRSLTAALQMFRDINQDILDKIECARMKNEQGLEAELLLRNTILVHEIADALIGLLEDFKLNGKDTLKHIEEQIEDQIKTLEQEDMQLRFMGTQPDVSETIARNAREYIDQRREGFRIIREQWKRMNEDILKIESNVHVLRRQISNLCIIRANALNQLGFLQVMLVTKLMKDNVETFANMIQLEDLSLAPVTPNDLLRLLGTQPNVEPDDPEGEIVDLNPTDEQSNYGTGN